MHKFNFTSEPSPKTLRVSLEESEHRVEICISDGEHTDTLAWLCKRKGNLELNDCHPSDNYGLPQDDEGFIECNR